MYKIIQKKNILFAVSLAAIIVSIVFVALGGIKMGIDFTGGTLLEVQFQNAVPTNQEITDSLTSLKLIDLKIQSGAGKDIVMRMKEISSDQHLQILSKLQEKFGNVSEIRFDSIGPVIGKELQIKAIIALILVLLGIIFYLAYAFRKITGSLVSSWSFGLNAILALIHDVIITIGFFAILGYFFNIEIDTLFVTALLTIIGFSVHDTIVVFDRIREGLKKHYGEPFANIVNNSINETIVRSINTSFTTLLVLTALFIFGGETIRYFALALIFGIIVGTYSSIFIASMLLLVWYNIRQKRA